MTTSPKKLQGGIDVQKSDGTSALTVDGSTGAVVVGPNNLSGSTQHTINGALGNTRSAGIMLENATSGGTYTCQMSATSWNSVSGDGVAKNLGSAANFEGSIFIILTSYGYADLVLWSGAQFVRMTSASGSFISVTDSGTSFRIYESGGSLYFKDSTSGFGTRPVSIMCISPKGTRINNIT